MVRAKSVAGQLTDVVVSALIAVAAVACCSRRCQIVPCHACCFQSLADSQFRTFSSDPPHKE